MLLSIHMSITTSDIEKLASLARMDISEEEKASFAKEIDSILGYVEQLNTVSAQAIAGSSTGVTGQTDAINTPVAPLHRNQLRDDIADVELNPVSEILVKAAPQSEGGFVKVKKILNQ